MSSRNIIVIAADSLRPDYLGCYNGNGPLTTYIDDLAEMGTVFTRNISSASWTVPALASLMTGGYPQTIGLFSGNDDLSNCPPSVFERFSDAGYRTGSFFDSEGLREMWADGVDYHGMANSVDDILEFLAEDCTDPFFAFILYRGTHLPYDLKYSKESYYRSCERVLERLRHGGEEGLQEVKHRYETAVEQFSEWYLAAIIDRLEDQGELDETTIVITADHGETWTRGVDDMSNVDSFALHGTVLYEDVLRVPLIIANLGCEQEPRFDDITRTVDIVPSLYDTVGIEYEDDARIDGITLLPAIRGDDVESPEAAYSVTTAYENPEEDISEVGMFAITVKKYKLIWRPAVDETRLYNLRADPEETFDVADNNPEIAQSLQDKLLTHLDDRQFSMKDYDERAVREHLEDLGYL